MPSVDQLKHRLEALLTKIGADSLTRERKQIARAGSQTELRLLGTGLRDMLGKKFGDRWSNELDAVFGKSTTIQEEPPTMPPSTMPPEHLDEIGMGAPLSVDLQSQMAHDEHAAEGHVHGQHTRFGTMETYAAIKQQPPAQRVESLRAYLIHAAKELLEGNSAPMEQKIANAKNLVEMRGVARAMAEIARLSHSEATVERFIYKVNALFAAVEEGPLQH
jgi:hypothetical protein